MTRGQHRPSFRFGRLATAMAITALVMGPGGITSAHGPDPIMSGGMFAQNQDLRFRWRPGAEPTTVIKNAIRAAATDANATRASKAATFTYDPAGTNLIGYGLGATCGVNGIGCFTRTAPNGFTMWLREQGHVFDWGTLKWCQAYATPPNGCYDAENIALDEFGHVEGLDHHDNLASDSDYADAVVQTFSRTKPSPGWNAHAFGTCDVATLQLQYDVPSWTTKYSTCLDLTTELTITALKSGLVATITATLRVADPTAYVRLGANPVSGRTISVQRRTPGTTTWTTVGTMSAASASGTYTLATGLAATTEFRAVFKDPTDEGLRGDTSAGVTLTVIPCPHTTLMTTAVPCA